MMTTVFQCFMFWTAMERRYAAGLPGWLLTLVSNNGTPALDRSPPAGPPAAGGARQAASGGSLDPDERKTPIEKPAAS